MPINLANFTAEGNYPPFISVNLLGRDVEVTIRATPYKSDFKPAKASAREPWLVVGQQATIVMPLAVFSDLLRQISEGFHRVGI
jgi:hypothetical protein